MARRYTAEEVANIIIGEPPDEFLNVNVNYNNKMPEDAENNEDIPDVENILMESDEQCKAVQKMIDNVDRMLKRKSEDSPVLITEKKAVGGIGKDIDFVNFGSVSLEIASEVHNRSTIDVYEDLQRKKENKSIENENYYQPCSDFEAIDSDTDAEVGAILNKDRSLGDSIESDKSYQSSIFKQI